MSKTRSSRASQPTHMPPALAGLLRCCGVDVCPSDFTVAARVSITRPVNFSDQTNEFRLDLGPAALRGMLDAHRSGSCHALLYQNCIPMSFDLLDRRVDNDILLVGGDASGRCYFPLARFLDVAVDLVGEFRVDVCGNFVRDGAGVACWSDAAEGLIMLGKSPKRARDTSPAGRATRPRHGDGVLQALFDQALQSAFDQALREARDEMRASVERAVLEGRRQMTYIVEHMTGETLDCMRHMRETTLAYYQTRFESVPIPYHRC